MQVRHGKRGASQLYQSVLRCLLDGFKIEASSPKPSCLARIIRHTCNRLCFVGARRSAAYTCM